MTGQLVGGAFLSAFLQVAFDRLASPELKDFICQWKIDLDEVENLKRTSALIQALIDDAEVKQFTNPAVKLWLDQLKQLLYDAEDVLDGYATEILRVKLESSESQVHPVDPQQVPSNPVSLLASPPPHPSSSETSSSIVRSWLNSGIESAVNSINETLNEIKGIPYKVYDIFKGYGSKVKQINEKLKGVQQHGSDLGLSSSSNGAGSSRSKVFSERPQTSSLVNKDKVFGREKDKEKIIEFLVSDENTFPGDNFSVLPIVGMGGVGKTTLEQFVYNDDDRLKDYFDLKAWVYVSEDFDVVRMTKEILESVTGRKPESDLPDRIHTQLKAELSEKRFLLVLDDVWNSNYNEWDRLQTPFAAGARGSKILVTTRDYLVSSTMHTLTAHRLEYLSDEDCIKLLRSHALVDGNSQDDANRKLKMFGGKVAKKCKGLPLAVKAIAGLLRDKIEDSEWEAKNEIWDLEGSEILPSLMLSYHHLPPHLKRCFAYCALFPKDYTFEKAKLVRLWMGEGIMQLSKGSTKRLEDIGVGYFDHLFMRSFFELSDRPSEFISLYEEVEDEGSLIFIIKY